MRATYKEIMEFLGINRQLIGYETDMHLFTDDEKEQNCSAETRVVGMVDELEIEIQAFGHKDEKPENDDEDDDNDTEDAEEGTDKEDGTRTHGDFQFQQILALKIKPRLGDKWEPYALMIKGQNKTNKFSDWDAGACAFYNAVVAHLKRDEMPDFNKLIAEHLNEDSFGGIRGRRGGGRKNPKFKPPNTSFAMKQGL